MLTIGIDVGIANTGVVGYERRGNDERFTFAETITTRPTDGDEYAEIVDRAVEVATRVVYVLKTKLGDESPFGADVVIESFVDQQGRRHFSRRYMTPLVIGALAVELKRAGFVAHYQSAAVMKPAMNDYLNAWKRKRSPFGRSTGDRLIEGDFALTNDHLRDAGAHAVLHSLTRLKEGNRNR